MPGANIEPEFHGSLSAELQRVVLRQVAEVLKAVQDFALPAAAAGFSGLAFDEANDGSIVSGTFVIEPYTDPYPDIKSFYRGTLQAQLKEADKTVANGWRENGLRERLDAFALDGLDRLLLETLTRYKAERDHWRYCYERLLAHHGNGMKLTTDAITSKQ